MRAQELSVRRNGRKRNVLKSIYTLTEKYESKKIVIYGVNRNAITVFTILVLNHQIDIFAFWDESGRFCNDKLINRQVITTGQLLQMDDAIIILPEPIEKQRVEKYIGKRIPIFYKDEIIGLNKELKKKDVYLYGIGKTGEMLYDLLMEEGIGVKGVCVTTSGNIDRWNGKDVCSLEHLELDDDCAIILATTIEKYKNEMLKQLEACKADKYIPYLMREHVISEGNFFQVINIALLKDKDIWLYGHDNEIIQYIEELFAKYQIRITKKICDKEIFDLEFENIDTISVVVVENDKLKTEWACDVLDSIGFGLEKWDYTAIELNTLMVKNKTHMKRDCLLGVSVKNQECPGYMVYGDSKTAKIKIMIGGGSTSTDGVYRTGSWVKFFYEKLLEEGYDVVLYNGSVCAHSIVEEFLHAVRDIAVIKPDYVISFSGVNNTCYKNVINQFATYYSIPDKEEGSNGIGSDETLYDFWYRISKLMKLVCEQHGAKFYSFLQPMSLAKEELDLVETGMFDLTEHKEHVRYFKSRALAEDEPIYTNMISLLEGKQMYIDAVHYSTEGNRIIAEYIFEVISRDMLRI